MITAILFQRFIIVLVFFIFGGCCAQSAFLSSKKMYKLLKKDNPARIEKKIKMMADDQEGSQKFCESLFFHAARLGSIRTIKYLVNRGVSLDVRSPFCFERTPLHHALAYSNTSVALYLICHGADFGTKDRLGNTPLHIAAHRGLLSLVELLLKRGVAVDEQDEHNYTALHNAVEQGRVREVHCLLQAGANPNAQTCNGDTPLHLALVGFAHHPQKRVMQKQLLSIIKILGNYPLDFSKREVYNQWNAFDLLNYLNFSQSEHKCLASLLKKLQTQKMVCGNKL